MLRETVGITVALCAIVPALLPMTQRGITVTHDGLLHVQRLIALDAAVRQGVPFSRWLPDLAYGYGQPLLLYYAPLAYLPGLVARAVGLGYVTSFEVASVLALACSVLAMYLLARSLFDVPAATTASVVYGLLPYQLVDIYVRGALAESWAFVWLPLCAWCIVQAERAERDKRPRWSVGLALSLAGLVLTHNVTALLFLPALMVLAAGLAVARRPISLVAACRPLVAMGFGLALSAWFWLPALAERTLVQIGETLEPDLFASFFLRSWPPFRPDLLYDYERPVSTALGFPVFWPQLGVVQVVVSLAGLVFIARLSRMQAVVATWAGLLVVGGYALQLAPLAPLYDAVPLLAFVQFPWRLLAPIGFGSAVLAGVLVEAVSTRLGIRVGVAALVAIASLATAVGRLNPETAPVDESALTTTTVVRSELADYHLGTTHSGEYLPVTSGQRNTNRLRKTILDVGNGSPRGGQPSPSTIRVERVDWRPGSMRVEVTASAPDRLVIHQFAFPGWSASIDGAPVPVVANGSLGLIAVDLPAGQHVVDVTWGWTPLRLATAGFSLSALVALAGLGATSFTRPGRRALAGTVSMAGAIAILVVPSWPGLPISQAGSGGTGQSLAVDDGLTLVDSSVDTSRLRSDRIVQLRQVWLATRSASTGYRATLEATAPDGAVARATWTYEALSRLWSRGELVQTATALRLPPSFTAGASSLRQIVEQPSGIEPIGLGRLEVPQSQISPDPPAVGPSPELLQGVRLSGTGRLRGRSGGPDWVRSGGVLDLSLRWSQSGSPPDLAHDLLVTAAILAPAGDLLSEPRRAGDWYAPLPFWNTGESSEQQLRVAVPAGTPPGTYPVVVRVYALDLARGGVSESGASISRPRGRPIAQVPVGSVAVVP